LISKNPSPKKKNHRKIKEKKILNKLFPTNTPNYNINNNIDNILKEEIEKYLKEIRKPGEVSK
jgi:hypothetical protein